ncbi:hypothetical protein HQ520_00975 [bacterium]|nr:hypothetical protein [bacterium]
MNFRPRIRSGFILLLALALFPVSCGLFKPREQKLIEAGRLVAKGTGQAPAQEQWSNLLGLSPDEMAPPKFRPEEVLRPGRDFPKWADRSLEAQGKGVFPPEANSPVQAQMLARQAARDQALRNLADQVALLPSPQGGMVEERLIDDPDLRAQLDATLRSSVEYEGLTAGEEHVVKARLPLRPVALVLYGESREIELSPSSRPSSGVAISTEEMRRIAYESALEKARMNLLATLEAQPLILDRSAGDLAQRDAGAALYLRSAVENASVERVEYPDERTCEITLSLDPEPVLRRLRGTLGR